jgi:hypothetical protein
MIKYRSPWHISISYNPIPGVSSVFRSLQLSDRELYRCCVSRLHRVSYFFVCTNRHHMRRVPDF